MDARFFSGRIGVSRGEGGREPAVRVDGDLSRREGKLLPEAVGGSRTHLERPPDALPHHGEALDAAKAHRVFAKIDVGTAQFGGGPGLVLPCAGVVFA
jgi:hypothetical protein